MAESRVSQVAAEILHAGAPVVRVSQVAAEVLHTGGAPVVRVSQVAVEVLRSVADYADLTTEIKTNTMTIDSGSGTFEVPDWVGFFKAEAWGAGGGSPGYEVNFLDVPSHVVGTIVAGGDGGNTTITTFGMTANGGQGSGQILIFTNHPGGMLGSTSPQITYSGTLNGAGGSASGGDVNVSGIGGASAILQQMVPTSYSTRWVTGNGILYFPNHEGMAGKGGGMDVPVYYVNANIPIAQPITGTPGVAPARGANGAIIFASATGGYATSGGGQGGYTVREWLESDSDAPTPGSFASYSVGAAGAAGTPTGGNANRIFGATGATGRVRFTWGTYYSVGSAADSDAASSHDVLESSVPESDESEAEVDLFPGVPRTPAPPTADYDSMWSVCERIENGLIPSYGIVSNDSGSFASASFNGNYGLAAGDGPFLEWNNPTGPNVVYLHWTTSQGIKLRGLRFIGGGSDLGIWSVWAGFSHSGPMIPICDSFVLTNDSNGVENETIVFGIIPSAYDLDFTYFEIRFDGGPGLGGSRPATEIEIEIAHSNLDGGDRTGAGDPHKRIFVTSDIALDVPNSTYDGTWKGIIAGRHHYKNRSGAISTSAAVTTLSPVAPGKKIEFKFPREVGMREMVLESSTVEAYDSAGDPMEFGTWQWSGSNNGDDWTNVGGVLKFGEGSDCNLLPSPQDTSPSSDEGVIRYRYWRLTSVSGYTGTKPLWGVTFNLDDPIFGHAPSDIDGGSGDSDESDFTSSGDIPSSIDSSGVSDSGAASDSGSASDSSGASSASDSSASPSSSDTYTPGSFASDSFGDHDPDTLPVVQVGVVALY